MAIATITAWLDNPNRSYHHGRALYEQYGDNKVVLTLIKSGSGSFHLSKLKEGLEKVNLKSNLVPKQIVIPDYVAPEPVAAPGKTNPDFTSAPKQITRIRDEKNIKYAQARKLFEMIRVMDSREHRMYAGLQLLDLMDEVNEAWSIIDKWKDTGKVNELKKEETEIQVANLSIPELMKEAKNLPTYITKDRQKLEKASDKKKVEISFRLEWRITRLKLINIRLNEIV